MGLIDKFKNFVTTEDDDEEELVYEEEEVEPLSSFEAQKSPIRKVSTETKMVLFEPRSFDEAEEIARHLKSRRAAVVNLHKLQRDYAQRTIDFLTGVIVALDGSIQKIGHNVILCAPKNVGVDGQINLDNDE